MRRIGIGLMILALAGCKSPEDGRPRDGGSGGDRGNYPSKPIGLSSKVDGSKPITGPVR